MRSGLTVANGFEIVLMAKPPLRSAMIAGTLRLSEALSYDRRFAMKITLKDGEHWAFRIVAESGATVVIENDWDFPAAAAAFGWERREATGNAMLWDAFEYLEQHIGDTADDSGYF